MNVVASLVSQTVYQTVSRGRQKRAVDISSLATDDDEERRNRIEVTLESVLGRVSHTLNSLLFFALLMILTFFSVRQQQYTVCESDEQVSCQGNTTTRNTMTAIDANAL